MKTRTIFATLAIPATAAGLLAQDDIIFRKANKEAAETMVLAQGAVAVAGFAGGEPGNVRFMTREFSFNGKTVTNAPYSAEEKTESVQTLADGTKITNTTTARVYRDSQGRTRQEVSLPVFGGETPHTMITISDPVAGVNYTLETESKTAHQMPPFMAAAKMKAMAEADAKMTEGRLKELKSTMEYKIIRRSGANDPTVKHEELGGNVIEGVSATGTRETSTIEAGSMGNDRPIQITSERWYSPELQLEVKSVRNDPRMGQTTHTLTNISRAEPDASLFKVPSDYKLDEGKSGLSIRTFDVRTDQ